MRIVKFVVAAHCPDIDFNEGCEWFQYVRYGVTIAALDIDNRKNFEIFVRMMEEQGVRWGAPLENMPDVGLSNDEIREIELSPTNEMHYYDLLADLIKTNDPLLSHLPEDHVQRGHRWIENAKRHRQEELKTVQQNARFFVQRLADHIQEVAVLTGINLVPIHEETSGLQHQVIFDQEVPISDAVERSARDAMMGMGVMATVDNREGKYTLTLTPSPNLDPEWQERYNENFRMFLKCMQ